MDWNPRNISLQLYSSKCGLILNHIWTWWYIRRILNQTAVCVHFSSIYSIWHHRTSPFYMSVTIQLHNDNSAVYCAKTVVATKKIEKWLIFCKSYTAENAHILQIVYKRCVKKTGNIRFCPETDYSFVFIEFITLKVVPNRYHTLRPKFLSFPEALR